MIQSIDPLEICSLAEQSNRSQPGAKRNIYAGGKARLANPQETADESGHLQSEAVGRLEKVFAHMLAHLDRPVPISTLGKLAGVSSSTFYLLFKTATGHTPNDFFTRARIARAGELLQGTKLRVKEVAAVVGYEDQFYFSRVFKSVQGISPRDYRTAMSEGDGSKVKAIFSHRNLPAAMLHLAAAGPCLRAAEYARTSPLTAEPTKQQPNNQ